MPGWTSPAFEDTLIYPRFSGDAHLESSGAPSAARCRPPCARSLRPGGPRADPRPSRLAGRGAMLSLFKTTSQLLDLLGGCRTRAPLGVLLGVSPPRLQGSSKARTSSLSSRGQTQEVRGSRPLSGLASRRSAGTQPPMRGVAVGTARVHAVRARLVRRAACPVLRAACWRPRAVRPPCS